MVSPVKPKHWLSQSIVASKSVNTFCCMCSGCVLLCIVVSQEVIIRRQEDTMATSWVPCQSAGRSLYRILP